MRCFYLEGDRNSTVCLVQLGTCFYQYSVKVYCSGRGLLFPCHTHMLPVLAHFLPSSISDMIVVTALLDFAVLVLWEMRRPHQKLLKEGSPRISVHPTGVFCLKKLPDLFFGVDVGFHSEFAIEICQHRIGITQHTQIFIIGLFP